MVTQCRELKSNIVNVADDMGDGQRFKREKGTWLHSVVLQRTRDKWMISLSALLLLLNLVIAQLCANAKSVPVLMNMRHLFTADVKNNHDAIVHEVHSLSQHALRPTTFQKNYSHARDFPPPLP